jgi:hypothetical protein
MESSDEACIGSSGQKMDLTKKPRERLYGKKNIVMNLEDDKRNMFFLKLYFNGVTAASTLFSPY